VNLGVLGHHHEWTGTMPDAAFTFEPGTAQAGETIEFNASDSEPANEIDEYQWDLTDSSETDAIGETVEHTFEDAGDHPVTLTIELGDETDTSTEVIPVEVQTDEPQTEGFDDTRESASNVDMYVINAVRRHEELGWLAIGGGGIGTLIGGRYLLRRRKGDEQSEQESSEGPSSGPSDTSTREDDNSTDSTEQPESDDQSVIDELRSEAEIAIETAATAKDSANRDEAIDAYDAALTHYQVALDELDPGVTETRKEIEESIALTREKLNAVERHREQRGDLIEILNTAERSFQVGVVAYTEGSQTLARIRFRQARDAFEEAIDLVENSDDDLLTPPVEVGVQPERQLVSTTLSELPQVPETAADGLADAGVATLDELEPSEESPWLPDTVKTLVSEGKIDQDGGIMLSLLSWWDDTNNYEFDSEAAISRRREQADYGHTRSS